MRMSDEISNCSSSECQRSDTGRKCWVTEQLNQIEKIAAF